MTSAPKDGALVPSSCVLFLVGPRSADGRASSFPVEVPYPSLEAFVDGLGVWGVLLVHRLRYLDDAHGAREIVGREPMEITTSAFATISNPTHRYYEVER